MRVIFLDFDGVVVPWKSRDKKMRPAVPSAESVEALNLIVTATQSKVVVTSAWRQTSSLEALSRCLTSWGVRCHTIAKTQSFSNRGSEILAWLAENPQAQSFLVMDDEEVDLGQLQGHLLKTESLVGLTLEHVGLAIKLLKGPMIRTVSEAPRIPADAVPLAPPSHEEHLDAYLYCADSEEWW